MIVPRPLKKVREKITPFSQEDKVPAFNLGSGTADSTTVLHGDGTWQPEGEGIPPGGTAGQLLAKESDTNYDVTWVDQAPAASYTSVLKHTVKAGENLVKGQAVYVSSANGTNMVVSKASNITEATSSKTMGLIAQNLSTNGNGFVITEGLLAGLNTGSTVAGAPVWLGTNGNLIYGLVGKPFAPAHLVFIGVVTRANNNNGEIFVKVQNGFELNEIHDVDLKSILPTDGQVLQFEGASGLWKNKTLDKTSVGLGNVDNTSDVNKPVSTAQQTALNLKFNNPTGTTAQYVAGDGSLITFPSLGLTVGSTAISSGTNGRILFQNGGVLQQTANLFWDNTNARFGIGNSLPTARLHISAQGALSSDIGFKVRNIANTADLFNVVGTGQVSVYNNSTNSSLSSMDPTNTFAAVTLENFSLVNGTFKKVLGIQSYANSGLRYLTMSSLDDLHWNHRFTVAGRLTATAGIACIGVSNDFNSSAISNLFSLNLKNEASVSMRPDLNLGLTENNLGLFIAPNNTANPTKKLIKLMDSTLTTTFFTVNGSGQTAIGTDTPTARLHIAAQGALSSDIAFKVRNSANTADLFNVVGNGVTNVSTLTATAQINISQPAGYYYPTLTFSNNGGAGQGSIKGYNGRLVLSSSRIAPGNVFSINFGNFDANYAQLEVLAKDALSTSNSFGILNNAYTNYLFKVQNNGSIGIGTNAAIVSSAKVQIDSTTQGFLPPRMTNTERTAITAPAVGLIVYCTDMVEGLYIYKSTGWTFVI
jgi:hypothetical protein